MTKTLSISMPDSLAEKLEKYPEVNWSEVARTGFEQYIKERESKKEK